MIDQTLEVIRKEVNDFIAQKLDDLTLTNKVVLTSFVDDTGKVAIPIDSVGLSLLNIEEEKTLNHAGLIPVAKAENTTEFVNPPIALNLQLMFTAYFNNYQESLKHISYILACLQTKPVFDRENTPAVGTLNMGKLVFKLNTLPLEQQHYIWSMIGLRYLPSVIYQVRMLTVFERDIVNSVANIKAISPAANMKEVND